MYYEKDVDTGVLADKTIAVIGYGSQGMAQSRNMADSGLKVVVGLREGGDFMENCCCRWNGCNECRRCSQSSRYHTHPYS